MKSFLLLALTVLLVACVQGTPVAPVTPPVAQTPVPDMTPPPVVAPVEVPVEDPTEEPVSEDPVTETVTDEPAAEETTQGRVFNAQTLANYDGRDGRPAYIAIDGVVYDLSASPLWRNGSHNGFQAGQDLSRQIPRDHRADMRFERFPVVGTYE